MQHFKHAIHVVKQNSREVFLVDKYAENIKIIVYDLGQYSKARRNTSLSPSVYKWIPMKIVFAKFITKMRFNFFTPDTLKSIFAMTRDRISACRIKYHMMGDIPSYLSLQVVCDNVSSPYFRRKQLIVNIANFYIGSLDIQIF